MGFTDSFARVLPAAQRAFGIPAAYTRGADSIDLTMFVGPRDLAGRNTLGNEFAHIVTKEFVLTAADLVIASTLTTPAAGDVITWTDPQSQAQSHTVFPLWNSRTYDTLDLAESQLLIYAVRSSEVLSITPVGADPPTYVALAGSLRTTEINRGIGTREEISDRDVCRLVVAAEPGAFTTDQQLTVNQYSGVQFYVRSIERQTGGLVTLEVWREGLTKIQRRGTEAATN